MVFNLVNTMYLIAVCQMILVAFSGLRVVMLALIAARVKTHDDNFVASMERIENGLSE